MEKGGLPGGREKRLVLLLLVLTAVLTAGVLLFYRHLALRLMLIWNIFLAALPLGFSLLILRLAGRGASRRLQAVPWLLWLLFYPNAPYMITDLIHLERYGWYTQEFGFTTDPAAWFGLLHLCTGVFVGCIFGLLSLHLLQGLVAERHGVTAGWGFSGAVSALSGAAIYIGRVARLNSWDALANPFTVLATLWEGVREHTLLLVIFAAMSFLAYVLFRFCFAEYSERT